MSLPRPSLPGVVLLAGALACSQAEPADRDPTPSVVFQAASSEKNASVIPGEELGPSGAAPEVIVLGDPAPVEPATPRTVRRPDPGPQIIYRTIYVEEPAPAPESGETATEPIAGEAETPVPEPVVAETVPLDVPEPVEPSGPEPVATATPPTAPAPTLPEGGSSRTEDAIVGAAIGAGIGAILGGRDGAIAGGIGGAIGGAMGGRSGGILGGVIGAGGHRGGDRCIPRAGHWMEPELTGGRTNPGVIVDDFVLR
ncbi:MAG: hypothetical protein ACREK3_07905 [Gemmatimonadota bacterium]